MNQEVSSSKLALNRLQEQTEAYVNGTFTTMDSMEGKVGFKEFFNTSIIIQNYTSLDSGGSNYGTHG